MSWMGSKGADERSSSKLDALIAHGTSVQGEIRFAGGLRVDGVIRGAVDGADDKGFLVVGENGQIEGPVCVEHAVILGTVRGTLQARTVELMPSARVEGDVVYGSIEAHAGSAIQGKLMSSPVEAPVALQVVSSAKVA
jgi:cytoskeletal protein CcmA (bactofilin family)